MLITSLHAAVADGDPTIQGVADNGDGSYRVDLANGSTRAATAAEILAAVKAERIASINAEVRSRLIARYGVAEEQVSRAIGVYGVAEQNAMANGIAATVDASNVAQNSIITAANAAAVEAVAVMWPVI